MAQADNSVSKGNALEDEFFEYLCSQKASGKLVFGAYAPSQCLIYKKRSNFLQRAMREC
jgi:hypothetical protein